MFLKKSKLSLLTLLITASFASQVQASDFIIGNPSEELRNAAAKGEEQKVILLLNKDKNIIDKKDANGNTALIIATEKGNVSLVKILINMGADTTITNNAGQTAEDIAKSNKATDILNVLKQAGTAHPSFKINAEGIYNFWKPPHMTGATYKTTGFSSTSLEARWSPSADLQKIKGDTASLLANTFAKDYVLRYEFTPNNTDSQSKLIEAMNKDNGSSLKKWFLNMPIAETQNGYYSVSYDSQYFISNVTANTRKVYRAQDGSFILLGSGWNPTTNYYWPDNPSKQVSGSTAVNNISTMTKFREFDINFSEKTPMEVPGINGLTKGFATYGIFYLDYNKPFTMESSFSGENMLSIYDGKFEAIGINYQVVTDPGQTGYFIDYGTHVGTGKITLLGGSKTINTQYCAVNSRIGYRIVNHNNSMQLYVKGDFRGFSKSTGGFSKSSSTEDFNNDIIWSINANYLYKF